MTATRPDTAGRPTLVERLPPEGADEDAILEAFLDWTSASGFELYPAQEEALLELHAGRHVILATPTGSGKSLVALGLLFRASARSTPRPPRRSPRRSSSTCASCSGRRTLGCSPATPPSTTARR